MSEERGGRTNLLRNLVSYPPPPLAKKVLLISAGGRIALYNTLEPLMKSGSILFNLDSATESRV